MKTCQQVKQMRNKSYTDLLFYIERKIFSNLTKGYIYIDEATVIDNGVSFKDYRWVSLLRNKGYTVEYCANSEMPTIKISGW